MFRVKKSTQILRYDSLKSSTESLFEHNKITKSSTESLSKHDKMNPTNKFDKLKFEKMGGKKPKDRRVD